MCRFALYLGPPIRLSRLVTEPSNSIIHQSYDSQERAEPLNGDGFGVAWYVRDIRPEPAVFRSISPAWNNQNLLHLAPVTVSDCLLAHVRAATPGLPVTELNCHPFVRGRYAFMHNGFLPDFPRIVRPLRERLSEQAYFGIQGTTDSEHVFALMADHYLRRGEESLGALAEAMVASIAEIEQLNQEAGVAGRSYLNLAVTNGQQAVACRYVTGGGDDANSLYLATGCLEVDPSGTGRMVPCTEGHAAVLVASEPLGERSAWTVVPPNSLVVVDESHRAEVQAM